MLCTRPNGPPVEDVTARGDGENDSLVGGYPGLKRGIVVLLSSYLVHFCSVYSFLLFPFISLPYQLQWAQRDQECLIHP